MLALRRSTIGYVTQFLRVIPRVPAEAVVAEPLIDRGVPADQAVERARLLLDRLNIPERLWHLSPMTFSGGEQQRVNIARGFAAHFPILLLDEPTASLDLGNRQRVLELIAEARSRGSSIIGVFHDENERRRACTRELALG
jgi:alpha-D-ribose 1-methylphosphonate 5-triphosphate synthase subunit PhnL